MAVSRTFFRVGAGASLLAALAVLVTQFALTGYPRPPTPEAVAELYTHPVFRARGWVILVQVLCMFVALWACVLKGYRLAPGLVLTGFLFFVFWQALELLPRSIGIFAISYGWAPEFVASQDPSEQARLLGSMQQTSTLLDSIGYGRRVMWALGHLLFGLSFWRGPSLMKAIGLVFLFNAFRLFVRMGGEATGWAWLGSLSGGSVGFVVGMVVLFALIGWWLWREPEQLDATSPLIPNRTVEVRTAPTDELPGHPMRDPNEPGKRT